MEGTAAGQLQDKTIQCVDCPSSFVFTAKEQKYFKEKNLSEPKRCKSCREAKKARKQAEHSR